MPKRIITCVLCLLLLFADGNIVKASEVDAQNYESETDAENLACDDGMTQLQNARSYNPYVDTRYMSLSGYIYVNVVMPDGGLSIYKVDCSVPYNDYAGSQQITYTMQLVSGVDLGATLKDSSYYTKSDKNGYNLGYQESSRQYVLPVSVKFNNSYTGYHIELVGVTGQCNPGSVMTGYGANWVSFDTDTNDNGMTNYTEDKAFRHATYTVQYVPNKYTLTINPNGGLYNNATGSAVCYTVFDSQNYNSIGIPTRTGYNFTGWYVADGTPVWDSNGYAIQYQKNTAYWKNGYDWNAAWMGGCYRDWEHMLWNYDGDLTVYAHWAPYTHTVAFNANGGSGAPGNQTKTYGSTIWLSSTKPVRTGYTFTGWNTDIKGKGTPYNAGSEYGFDQNGGTATLYAQWKPITYKISYNGNGSTDGTTGASSHTYGTVSKLTANGFARAGYTFEGWNTKADGSGTAYNDRTSISNLTTVDGQTITLYAQWRLNPVTVTVPRSLILNQDGDGSFVIKADNETGTVTVNADDTINLTQKGKDQVLAGIVSFDRNTLTPDRHEIKGSINTESLSAGSWKGVLNLNITFKL